MVSGLWSRRKWLLAPLAAAALAPGCDWLADPTPVATVEITPTTVLLRHLADTTQLAVVAKDSEGKTLSAAYFEWRSADSTVAMVSGTGVVIAVGNGSTTITAAIQGIQGTSQVVVADSVSAFLAAVGAALAQVDGLSAAILENPAVASLLVLQHSLTLGGKSPSALGGTTFSLWPQYHTYAEDSSATGAPADAVRFRLYRTEPGRVVEPPAPTGYADLFPEPGADTVLTVRAFADGAPQADLQVRGFLYPDSTRFTIAGTLRLGAASTPITGRVAWKRYGVNQESNTTEYDIVVPRARVTLRMNLGLYRSEIEEGDGSVRIAVAGVDAEADSTVVEAVYQEYHCHPGYRGFMRLNGDSVGELRAGRFVVYGDTIASDILQTFWRDNTGFCATLGKNIHAGVTALVSPALFALRQLATPAGDLSITVTTAGTGLDPDGYVAVASEWGPVIGFPVRSPTGWWFVATPTYRWTSLPVNAGATMTGWPAGGSRTVTLTGLASNCVPDGVNSRTVVIPVNGTANATFAVTCHEAAQRSGQLLFTHVSNPYAFPRPADLFAVNADGTNLTKLAADVDSTEVWFSPDGARIAFLRRVGGNTLEASVLDGSEILPLGTRSGQDLQVRWSADGTRLALSAVPVGQSSDIFVVTPGTGPRENITRSPFGPDGDPAWAPDGSRIAFLSGAEASNVYTMQPDGAGLVKLTDLTSPGVRGHLAWSPDGGRLLFEARIRTDGRSEIFAMNSDGTGLTNLTQLTWSGAGYPIDAAPRWSPDGTRIAFERNPAWQPQVYIVNADGTNLRQISLEGGTAPEWAPDGAVIAFLGPRGLTLADTAGTWNMGVFGINPTRVRWRPRQP